MDIKKLLMLIEVAKEEDLDINKPFLALYAEGKSQVKVFNVAGALTAIIKKAK